MSDFQLYFNLGLDHITDPGGYDHALFLVTLSAVYQIKDWRRVILLATAFTLGHSLTLALTAMGWRFIPVETVEVLIPVTILLTAIFNIFNNPSRGISHWWSFVIAAVFGLIHGMGFAGFFVTMIAGMEENILELLFYFNLGIEAGQIGIILVFLGITWLAISIIRIPAKIWRIGVSCLGGCLAVWLLWNVVSQL